MSGVKFEYAEFTVLQVALIELAEKVKEKKPDDTEGRLELIYRTNNKVNELLVKEFEKEQEGIDLFWVGSHDEFNTTCFIFAKDHEQSATEFKKQTGNKHNFNFKLNDIFEQAQEKYRVMVFKP